MNPDCKTSSSWNPRGGISKTLDFCTWIAILAQHRHFSRDWSFRRHVLDAKRTCMFCSAKRACGMNSHGTGARQRHETTHFTITLPPSYTMCTVFAGRTFPPVVNLVFDLHFLSDPSVYFTKQLKWRHVKASWMFRWVFICTKTHKKQNCGLHDLHVSYLHSSIFYL